MNKPMNKFSYFSLTLLAAAALAGCSTTPMNNAMLDQAHSDYRMAQASPAVRDGAPVELKAAGDALASADAALARRDSMAAVDQLAYIAKQRTAVAQQAGDRKASEAAVAAASAERDKLRLAARTQEADRAQASAVVAQRDAASSQLDAQSAQRDARAAQRSAQASQQQSEASQRVAMASQAQAGEAEQRARALEAQLRELNAKQTDRGMVITIGDVLFDSGRAELKASGMHSIEKLAGFLKANPQRKALIEGFTDSVGSEMSNQTLSGRRAEAVRSAMLGMGVGTERIAAQGYGEAFPVAGNDSASGRQLNRRVEVVLSDETGKLMSR